jgi:hypothetical protein
MKNTEQSVDDRLLWPRIKRMVFVPTEYEVKQLPRDCMGNLSWIIVNMGGLTRINGTNVYRNKNTADDVCRIKNLMSGARR